METNNLTLEEAIRKKTDEEIDKAVSEFSSLLCDMTAVLYKTYNFLRQDPIKSTDGHLMVFQSRLGDELTGEFHAKMFKLAVDNNLDIFRINKQFRKDVESGKAIELGRVVITDTALSNILTSNELKFSLTFMREEDYEEKQRMEEKAKENIKNL